MSGPTEREWLEGLDVQSIEDALLEEAQLDDEPQPETEFYPLADEAFGPDSADGWVWL
jgi:hypothetical protein